MKHATSLTAKLKALRLLSNKPRVLSNSSPVPPSLPGTHSQAKIIMSFQEVWFGVIDKGSGNIRLMQIKEKRAPIAYTQKYLTCIT